jgi:uncharacterized membrane protein/uncharacterized membrane protein YeaQ/YmgE (transglycosylase-associated protein family)
MHVLIWLTTGLVAGWLGRAIMRSRARLGVVGDLTLGALGGAFGGRLFRGLGMVHDDGALSHALVALCGAMLLVALGRLSVWAWARSLEMVPPRAHAARALADDLESLVRRLDDWDRHVLSHVLKRERVARDVSAEFEAQLTLGQRVADGVASFGGSWNFIAIFFLTMVVWMLINTELAARFDPYPFILLNLVLSCLAALQAPVIMMSQNRQAEKDRFQARADYEINLKAEVEIMAMSARLDELRARVEQVIRQQQASARGDRGADPEPGDGGTP